MGYVSVACSVNVRALPLARAAAAAALTKLATSL